jgi:hypothetical protein
MPIVAQFGNPAPKDVVLSEGQTEVITYSNFDDSAPLTEMLTAFTDVFNGAWVSVSYADAPTWIACSDVNLQDALCAHYAVSPAPIVGVNA